MTISELRVLVCAAVLTAASVAHAQDKGGDPRVPFDAGRKLMEAKSYAEAAKKFEESVALRPTVGALLNLGDAYEKLARYASAEEAFSRAHTVSAAIGETARADEAGARARQLHDVVSTITVHHGQSIDGLTARIDGKPIDLEHPTGVDGGDHVVKFSATCREPWEVWVSVDARRDKKEVTPSAPKNSTCPDAPAPTTETKAGSVMSGERAVGIGLGAVGLVVVGVGAYFGVRAMGDRSDLGDACIDYPRGCSPTRKSELEDKQSDLESHALISTVGLITGVVLVAGGAVLYLMAPKETKTVGLRGMTLSF